MRVGGVTRALVAVTLLPLLGCSSTSAVRAGAHRPLDGADCGSGYHLLATAPTWRQLADTLGSVTDFGHVAAVRTVDRDVTGAGGHHNDRVVDLVNRRGNRLLQAEVWRGAENAWRASYFITSY